MTQKTCTPEKDVLLSDYPISKSTKFADVHEIQQEILAFAGSVSVSKHPSELTEAEINEMKATGKTYYIWSEKYGETADRLQIKGKEVLKHVYNTPAHVWELKCLEGCPE